jgi:hypothetical protein
MAHKLVFTGSFEEPNNAELCFEVYPTGDLWVSQEQEGIYSREPSKLEVEDIRTLINFLEKLLPKQ